MALPMILRRRVAGPVVRSFMEMRLKYGAGSQQAEFKASGLRHFVELQAKHIATLQKPADIVSQALDKPLGCYPFNELFRAARNVLIVVPDPLPPGLTTAQGIETFGGAKQWLPLLRERLNRLWVPDEEITILVARHIDTPPSEASRSYDFAPLVGNKVRVHWHDPHNHKALEYVGLTKRGTPVFVNRLLLDADHTILCGTVSHHPFAGYDGGPRLIVPGCAGQETISRHYALALDPEAPRLHSRCRDAVVEANPLQEDCREALRFITASFLVHTVLNEQQQVIGAAAGEPLQAFAASCRMLDDIFLAPIAQPAHLVIVSCGGFPHDRDYRAAHQALHRAVRVVRPGGVIILLAECREGLGSPALSNWFRKNAAGDHNEAWPNGEKIDWQGLPHSTGLSSRWFHQNEPEALIALSTMQKAREAHLVAVTKLEPAIAKSLGFTPVASLHEALALAETWLKNSSPSQSACASPTQKSWRDIFSAFVISNGTLLIPQLT
jgi:nickel-dependent lactate racemase